MDQRTGNLMTMHEDLHPRDDVNRLYVSRKEGRRGLASSEDSDDTSIQRLEDYIKKAVESNYSYQKQHRQPKEQPSPEKKLGRKTNV